MNPETLPTIGAALSTAGALCLVFRAIIGNGASLPDLMASSSVRGLAARMLVTAGYPLGAMMLVAGMAGMTAPMFLSGSDEERAAIRRKANEEYAAIIDRCKRESDGLAVERSEALARIEPASTAVAAHQSALRDAERKRLEAERAAADELAAAYQKAERDQEASLQPPVESGYPDLERTRRLAVEDAEATFNAETMRARRLPNLAERDAATRAARAKQEEALATVERVYRRAVDDAREKERRANVVAQEKAIRDVQAARRAEMDKRSAAALAYDRARRESDAALAAALASRPETRRLTAEFDSRLNALTASCDADKQAVLDRIRPGR